MLINAYSTLLEPPSINFAVDNLNHRDRNDPDMANQIQGFIGYVFKMAGDNVTSNVYYTYRHIQRVQHQFSFDIEDDQLDALANWCRNSNSILFLSDGTVRDPNGRVLVASDVDMHDAQAQVPFTDSAFARKVSTEEYLLAQGFEPPAFLPPVIGEAELDLRANDEVLRRVYALSIVSIRAESMNENDPISVDVFREKIPGGVAALTAVEHDFVFNDHPEQQQIINHVWRYEALWVLAWSLGIVDELPLANKICDVPVIAQAVLDYSESHGDDAPMLRSAGEILDALDLHFRLNWYCNQAGSTDNEPPQGILCGVVVERCYALNWLVNFEYAQWDGVTTPA